MAREIHKQKRPKEHEEFSIGSGLFYARTNIMNMVRSRIDITENYTSTTRKVMNLLALNSKFDDGECTTTEDEFCKQRNISKSNYLRLLKIVQDFYEIRDSEGKKDTSTNKKYMTILAAYDDLWNCGINREKFCDEHKISRTTFFRYIALIEKYVCVEMDDCGIALDEAGEYWIIEF
jgi:hypothetical protein